MAADKSDISQARQALRDSYQNLQNVADYCEKNYMEAPDKHKALESTVALVSQTVASVASQVAIAAQHMSSMLEEQSQTLQKEEAKVRFISLLLDIHAEKVSRRKVGGLTRSKKFPHSEKILYGEKNGPLASYMRHPINLYCLDQIGHGMTDTDTQQLSKTGIMSRRISAKSMGQTQHSSLRRSCRIKDPIPPPLVPEMVPCPTAHLNQHGLIFKDEFKTR
ncbi:ABI gene family member 3 [Gastrophryne carolinensis]